MERYILKKTQMKKNRGEIFSDKGKWFTDEAHTSFLQCTTDALIDCLLGILMVTSNVQNVLRRAYVKLPLKNMSILDFIKINQYTLNHENKE